MSDKAVLIVCGYLIASFVLGVLVGKLIRWGRTGTTKPECDHDWEAKGYGGAGWTLSVCRKCGQREIDPA
jgi:hypothetical protein